MSKILAEKMIIFNKKNPTYFLRALSSYDLKCAQFQKNKKSNNSKIKEVIHNLFKKHQEIIDQISEEDPDFHTLFMASDYFWDKNKFIVTKS